MNNKRGFALCLFGLLGASSCAPDTLPLATREHPCPPWFALPLDHYSNDDPAFLGCVVDTNLRMMVANPTDLDEGRPLEPGDGEQQTLAIEKYQQGKIKPFQGTGASGSAPQASGAQ